MQKAGRPKCSAIFGNVLSGPSVHFKNNYVMKTCNCTYMRLFSSLSLQPYYSFLLSHNFRCSYKICLLNFKIANNHHPNKNYIKKYCKGSHYVQ